MGRKNTDWDAFIKKWNYVFDEKLNKDTYQNFKEVFPDLLNKACQINSKIIRTKEFQKTKLYNDVNTRINFNDFPFYAKIRCIQEGLTQPLICCCGGTLSYSPQDSYYKRFCGPTCGTSHPDTQAKVNKTNQLKYGCNWSTQSQQMKDKSIATKQIHYNADHHMQNPEYYKKYKNELEVQTGYSNNFSNPTCKGKIKQTNIKNLGVPNPMQSAEVQEKIKQTNLERYGVENPFQSAEVQEKIKQTNLERYGVENPFQSAEVQEKVKQTNLERYGVENPSQSAEVQDKIKQTNIKNLGVSHPTQSAEVQEKVKQTNLERYGVENPFQSAEVQDKIKQTNLERYGVENPSQSKEVQEKSYITYLENHIDSIWDNILSNTHCIPLFDKSEYVGSNYDTLYQWKCTNCNLIYESYYCNGTVKVCPICTNARSLGEIELYNYIQSLIPDVEVIANTYAIIPPKELDIYIPSLKLAFEYNGDYWHSLKEDGYHEWKTSGCEAKDIRLYHILESEWKGNNNEVKNLIRSVLCRS